MTRGARGAGEKSFYRPVKQGLAFLALGLGLIIGLFALYSARWIFLLFLVGIGLGVVISPVFEALHQKMRVPRVLSAILFLVILAVVLLTVAFGVFQLLSGHVAPLVQKLPLYLHQIREILLEYTKDWPALQQAIQNIRVGDYLSRPFQIALKSLQLSGSVVFGVLFAVSTSVYFAVGLRRYRQGFLALFPAYKRAWVSEVLSHLGRVLRYWMSAQLISMAAVGVLTGLAMWLIGLQNWFVYGLITGLLEIIPYFGPFVSAALIGIVTIVTQPDKIWWVLLAFVFVQQMENYLLIPLIMKRQVDIPPVYLLVLLLVMGQWFGVIGVLVAPAILALARALLLKTYVRRMNLQTQPRA